MAFTEQDKLDLECKKLDEELRTLKRPFLTQPGTWFTIIPLLLSVALNLQQCSDSKTVQAKADLQLERTQLDNEKAAKTRDSLGVAKKEIDSQITKATLELHSVEDSASGLKVLLADLRAKLPDTAVAARKTIDNLQNRVVSLANTSKYAAANINDGGPSFKVSGAKNPALAQQKEQEGFAALSHDSMAKAVTSFTEAENAYNGYHNSYELAQALKQQGKTNDPATRKQMIKTILEKYNGYMPPKVQQALQDKAK